MSDNDTTTVTTAITPIVPTDYKRITTVAPTTHQNVKGTTDTFDTTTDTNDQVTGEFDTRVMSLINGVLDDSKKVEDHRANKRNFNRMLTLFGALLIGLVVTFLLTTPHILPAHIDKTVGPYTFVITILMDSGLALYGYIRKY